MLVNRAPISQNILDVVISIRMSICAPSYRRLIISNGFHELNPTNPARLSNFMVRTGLHDIRSLPAHPCRCPTRSSPSQDGGHLRALQENQTIRTFLPKATITTSSTC